MSLKSSFSWSYFARLKKTAIDSLIDEIDIEFYFSSFLDVYIVQNRVIRVVQVSLE